MYSLFPYNKPADGESLIPIKEEIQQLCSILKGKRSVALLGAPKTGRQTLVNQALKQLNVEKYPYLLVSVDLLKCFDGDEFESCYKASFKPVLGDEYPYLDQSDGRQKGQNGIQSEQIVFADEQADELMLFPDDSHDMKKADFSYLQLVRMAEQKSGKHVIVHFKNFHNILAFEDGEGFLMRLERVLTRYQDVSYIFNGSHLNAMSYIFQERKYFHGFASTISIEPLARKDVMWYIERQFLKRGKEIDQKYINQIFDTCGGHPWYIMHLASICQAITIGYVSNPLMEESISTLIAIHEARFKDYVADLTEQQRNLLRAVLDAPQHLTSAESIEKYNLVSSAHVARSRGALKKKEIVYFGAETAKVIDPLFEFWLRNCYFER